MSKTINKIITLLMASEFILNLGWGVMAPVFSIFIFQHVTFGSVNAAAEVAGFATFFYWIIKSILQIPIGRYLDRNHGEKDDFWFVVIGTLLTGLIPIGYLFSDQAWQIYVWQGLYGVAAAMMVPSWYAIFTRHIDKGKEAVEWSLDSTFTGVGAGIAGAGGGLTISLFGFTITFIMVSVFTLISAFLLYLMKDEILASNKDIIRIPIERIP